MTFAHKLYKHVYVSLYVCTNVRMYVCMKAPHVSYTKLYMKSTTFYGTVLNHFGGKVHSRVR